MNVSSPMFTNAPTSMIVPPSRTILIAFPNEPGKPVALTTRSTLRSSSASAGSAPATRAATSSRFCDGSIANTRPAPISCALIACAWPSAPTPITATLSPGRKPDGRGTCAARSSEWVTAKISVRTATSSGNESGTRKIPVRGLR